MPFLIGINDQNSRRPEIPTCDTADLLTLNYLLTLNRSCLSLLRNPLILTYFSHKNLVSHYQMQVCNLLSTGSRLNAISPQVYISRSCRPGTLLSNPTFPTALTPHFLGVSWRLASITGATCPRPTFHPCSTSPLMCHCNLVTPCHCH